MPKPDGALAFLEPIETRSRNEAVQQALIEMIQGADLKIGDRLPPETSLAATLHVGRSTIREALNRWEGLGIIRRRRGDGTYLSASVQAINGTVSLGVQLEGEALLKVFEVRRTLEHDVVRKAALNANTAQRQLIKQLCEVLLAEVDSGRPWQEADAAFHQAIYDAAGNQIYGKILKHLDSTIDRDQDSPFSRHEFGLNSFPLHRTLSDAIQSADPDAAEEAVNQLLDAVIVEVQRIIRGN